MKYKDSGFPQETLVVIFYRRWEVIPVITGKVYLSTVDTILR